MNDHINRVLSQWETILPNIDHSPLSLPGRLARYSRAVSDSIATNLDLHGLESWQFDVLSTLRRSDHALTATGIAEAAMISCSALTNRIDRLLAAGLLTRKTDPDNRRQVLIALTRKGEALIDAVIPSHLNACRQAVSALDADDQRQLNNLLRKALYADEEHSTS